jgi:methyl-accepting chemotaxis protein
MLGAAKTLLLSPRLVVRALDDLHTLAEASAGLATIEPTLAGVERDVVSRVDALEHRLAEVTELAERIERALPATTEVLERIDKLNSHLENVEPVVEVLPALEKANASIDTLSKTAEALAASVEPLEGTVERLGRIANRLPGGNRRSTPS